jgi:hypothetical protein
MGAVSSAEPQVSCIPWYLARKWGLRLVGRDDILAVISYGVALNTGMMLRRVAKVLALLSVAVLLSGCVTLPDPEASQEIRNDIVGTIDGAHTIGQTFLARRPRLNGVELWLRTLGEAGGSATMTVEFFTDLWEAEPLVSTDVAVIALAGGDSVRVLFPPQPGSAGQHYYLRLRASGARLGVLGRNEDGYPGGQAVLDGTSIDADLSFRLLYDYGLGTMLGDLFSVVPRAWLALPLAVLLLLPGWLLLDLAGLCRSFDLGEQVALATGLSVALVPVVLVWTGRVGLHWRQPAVVIAAALLVMLGAWRLLRRQIRGRDLESRTASRESIGWRWALAGIFALSLAVRLAMVRDYTVPAWVDSVHHALIAQLIVDEGSLPATYAPFIQADTASYHAGFHSLVATFHWLSGLDVARALLLLAQVLNALVVPAAYLLAKELTGDRIAGLVAALVVGLFSPMPAYYASWGRFTQLAGLLMLPVALVLTKRALILLPLPETAAGRQGVRNDGKRWEWMRASLLATLALSGLILTHYRVAAFFGCLLLAYLVGQRYGRGVRWRHLASDGWRVGLMGWGALVLTLPWFVPTLTTLWLPKLQTWSGTDPAAFSDFSWRYLTLGNGSYVLVLALVGLAWALALRRRFALTLLLWVGLLFVLASMGIWGLPGGGFVNYVSVEISLFFPLSVLVGYALSQLLAAWQSAVPAQWSGAFRGVVVLLFGMVVLYGAWALLPILNADTVLMRQADEPAIDWIRESTPGDARFLVNPAPWSAYMYAGHDGGYWISPLARRQTVPPPVLYGLGSREEIDAINRVCAAVGNLAQDPAALWSLLRKWGITHLYIGARGGVLSAKALDNSEYFSTVYTGDGAWVFEVSSGK